MRKYSIKISILISLIAPAQAYDWQAFESKAQNAVIQILANVAKFDWMQPFRSPQQAQGAGSAFFINKDGYILTNFHVIDEAKSAWAFVPALGRRPLDIKIIGVCPEADIALLKLTDESMQVVRDYLGEIPFLKLGDSDTLSPREPVLALGYPLGQRYLKSTVGVMAGRDYFVGKSFMHITAPINPGNSGGPLLNRAGEVVGINTRGIPRAAGMGFIVPINDAKILLDDLHKTKLLRKPDLGVDYNTTTEEHAATLGNPWPGGVYISSVATLSVAERIGLKSGDMLYEINGWKVDQFGDVTVKWRSGDKVLFKELLIRFPVNYPLKLIVYRKGTRIELSGLLESPAIHPIRYVYPDFEPESIQYEMFAGLCIMQLRDNHFGVLPKTALLNQYARTENQVKEVLVITAVLPGSLADKIECFSVGTFISKINQERVTNLDQLRKALLKSAQTGDIAITTEENYATVLSLDKILYDEQRLSQLFKFGISPTLKKLSELVHRKPSYAYLKDR
jgi:serine protease Do